MYQTSCPSHATDDRPDEAPFADERGRYLRHCAEHGAKAAVLKVKRNELLWIATRLDLNARDGVDMVMLSRIAQERQGLHGAVTAERRVIDIGRPWLRFLGWWREPIVTLEHQDKLDQYAAWMRGSPDGRICGCWDNGSTALGGLLTGASHPATSAISPSPKLRCRRFASIIPPQSRGLSLITTKHGTAASDLAESVI